MKNRVPRVLIIAEAANPEWVSVPLVGWKHAKALLDTIDGHLVTQIRNQKAVERAGLVEGKDFTSIDSERVAAPLHRLIVKITGGKGKAWTVGTAIMGLAYYYFEYKVWKKFKKSLIQGEYDIIHRITPLSPTTPSLLAKRCKKIDIPFVLGPLNGGVPWPKEFDSARRKENEWLSYIRSAYKLMPYYRSTLRNSSAILVASNDTFKQVPKKHQGKCFYLPENAIDPLLFPIVEGRETSYPIRAVFLGRLVPYKGPDMLLEAIAPLLIAGNMRLDVLGDGPMLNELKHLADKLGISEFVNFLGWVEHKDIQGYLRNSDLLTFPSIREFGGGVVLEAMALGIIPVVVNYGGVGELVTRETGFTVPIGDRGLIINNFRDVLISIVENPDQLKDMRECCLRRAHKQFTWEEKAKNTVSVYNWLLNNKSERPELPFPSARL